MKIFLSVFLLFLFYSESCQLLESDGITPILSLEYLRNIENKDSVSYLVQGSKFNFSADKEITDSNTITKIYIFDKREEFLRVVSHKFSLGLTYENNLLLSSEKWFLMKYLKAEEKKC